MYQDSNHLPLQPFGGPGQAIFVPFNVPGSLPANDVEGTDEEEEGEDEGYTEGEQEGDEVESESGWSETDSCRSTSVTTVGTVASVISEDDDDMSWVNDPTLNLGELEQLRGSFLSELEVPSAWLIQRVARMTDASGKFGALEVVRNWHGIVAEYTVTPAGEPLRLPRVARSANSPFYRTWEEVNMLGGAARESCFGRGVGEVYKQVARVSIDFLIPGARIDGLSAGDRKRIYTVALNVSAVDQQRAQGLLWVMDREYNHARRNGGREWANSHAEEFMVYTVLYPPPIHVFHH